MQLMVGSLYDALRAANVDHEKARKAAEEAASFGRTLGEIRGDLKLLKWMTGICIVITCLQLLLIIGIDRG